MEAFKRLKERVESPTPKHFKRWRKGGVVIFGVGVAIKVAAVLFPPTMPAGIAALAPDLIAVGLTVAGISSTARK